jgi:hypothetical protein
MVSIAWKWNPIRRPLTYWIPIPASYSRNRRISFRWKTLESISKASDMKAGFSGPSTLAMAPSLC